jgi:hypothetical protein
MEPRVVYVETYLLIGQMMLRVRILWIQFKSECKGWSDSKLRDDLNLAAECFNDLLWNNKTEPYPMNVHILIILDISKEFEQFILICLFDANASVNDAYL